MKLMKFFVLFGALFLVGCGSTDSGTPGDANDPAAAGGSDEAQMGDETGDVSGGGEEALGGGAE